MELDLELKFCKLNKVGEMLSNNLSSKLKFYNLQWWTLGCPHVTNLLVASYFYSYLFIPLEVTVT
jgi:hypothetical protein